MKGKFETRSQVVNKRLLEDENHIKVNNEKNDIIRAGILFNNLPEVQKQNISLMVEKLIDERYNKPRIGLNIFKEIVIKDLAVEYNWDFKKLSHYVINDKICLHSVI